MSEPVTGGYTGQSESAQIPVTVDNSYILTAAEARGVKYTPTKPAPVGIR